MWTDQSVMTTEGRTVPNDVGKIRISDCKLPPFGHRSNLFGHEVHEYNCRRVLQVKNINRKSNQISISECSEGNIFLTHSSTNWDVRRSRDMIFEYDLDMMTYAFPQFCTPPTSYGNVKPSTETTPWRYCRSQTVPNVRKKNIITGHLFIYRDIYGDMNKLNNDTLMLFPA